MLLFFPVIAFSQYDKFFFIDIGTSIHQPFSGTQNSSGLLTGWCASPPSAALGSYKYTLQNLSTFSFYSKIGFDYRFIKKKNFAISFPYIFGYREQRITYCEKWEVFDYYTSSTEVHQMTSQQYYRMFSLAFGPKTNFQFKKWSFFTALYLNAEFILNGNYSEIGNDAYGRKFNYLHEFSLSNTVNDLYLNISLQNGLVYNINSKFGIGLTFDMFLYNINSAFYKYNPKDNHLFYFSGYSSCPYSTIINAGIRFEFKFESIIFKANKFSPSE